MAQASQECASPPLYKPARLLVALLVIPCTIAACNFDLDAPIGGSSSSATQTPTATATAMPTALPFLTPTSVSGTAPQPDAYIVNVAVSPEKTQPISPLIYGVAHSTPGDEANLQWLGATFVRWGGNARSMHNWEINASNTGSDNSFTNVSQGDSAPGSASLLFMRRNEAIGAASLLTIPTLGWVAKDSSGKSVDVPEHGGPPVENGSDTAFTLFKDGTWTAPYDPTANRERTSVRSLPSKNGPYTFPPDLEDNKVYQDEWVAYLRGNRAASDPFTIYAMDNEPDLWADNTHVDVHPVRVGYDTGLTTFLTYARAVKKADPSALVAGPEASGVTGYLFSALDEGGDKYRAAADRLSHGGSTWLEWFLSSVSAADKQSGARSLDILTLHYYPNAGQYTGGNEPAMQDLRMAGPRALWDGLYVEPSWVADTEWANLALVRRVKDIIRNNYPGTKLGITEWNFGGENDISGAIATADTLGIFGREGVYCASYWGVPAKGSPAGWAFRLFRNYDGKGSSFGTESVQTVTGSVDNFSAYSGFDAAKQRLTMVLINKDRTRTAYPMLSLGSFKAGSLTQYNYSRDTRDAPSMHTPAVSGQGSGVSVAPMTISVLAFERAR